MKAISSVGDTLSNAISNFMEKITPSASTPTSPMIKGENLVGPPKRLSGNVNRAS